MAKISLRTAYERLSSINLIEIAAECLQRRENDVTNLLREQAYNGISGDGTNIGEYNNAGNADYKHDLNPLPGLGNVDLYLTGQFYRGWSLEVGGSTYSFPNSDSKAAKLTAKYGEKINRLAPDTRVRVWKEVLRSEMVEEISRRTGFAIV